MDVTAVLIVITLFSIVGGVLVLWLVTRHRERTTMLEKGFKPEEMKELYRRGAFASPNPLSSLKWGLVFTMIGIAVVLAMFLDSVYNLEEGIYFGLISLFGGMGLVIFYAITSKKVKQA
jgi:Domain of unknown function (DUF6249)